jgi:hypothetical protein
VLIAATGQSLIRYPTRYRSNPSSAEAYDHRDLGATNAECLLNGGQSKSRIRSREEKKPGTRPMSVSKVHAPCDNVFVAKWAGSNRARLQEDPAAFLRIVNSIGVASPGAKQGNRRNEG